MSQIKIAVIVGTRPEIIKMSPVIRELQSHSDIEFFIIHSNQHYSHNLDSIFFQELNLPEPRYNLNIGSGSHSYQIGKIMIEIEPILLSEKPNLILVQGDTNTVMASAIAAHKLGVKVGHIEAGLRSRDLSMPEESNRIITDHISDLLFAVTEVQKRDLLSEGLSPAKIKVVGNTIVDAVLQNIDLSLKSSKILAIHNLVSKEYCLFTAHRASNVDTREGLQDVCNILKCIPHTVFWPIHHRALKCLKDFEIVLPGNVLFAEPVGYFDFLCLEKNAKFIVTDSGGVQEEACILNVPCITIRENTERPETVSVGANTLTGRDLRKFQAAIAQLGDATWVNPFGNGDSSKLIVESVKSLFAF